MNAQREPVPFYERPDISRDELAALRARISETVDLPECVSYTQHCEQISELSRYLDQVTIERDQLAVTCGEQSKTIQILLARLEEGKRMLEQIFSQEPQ